MPYLSRSPSKMKFLPGWLRRQQQDVVDREYARQIAAVLGYDSDYQSPPNFSVPRGAQQ